MACYKKIGQIGETSRRRGKEIHKMERVKVTLRPAGGKREHEMGREMKLGGGGDGMMRAVRRPRGYQKSLGGKIESKKGC